MSKFCTNCGHELDKDVNNCPNCGAKVGSNSQNVSGRKSKMAAGLLGIFLGALGVHNFYLGYTGKAVGQLLLTVLSCGMLSFVSWIWGLVEGIMILSGSITTDAQGEPLGD